MFCHCCGLFRITGAQQIDVGVQCAPKFVGCSHGCEQNCFAVFDQRVNRAHLGRAIKTKEGKHTLPQQFLRVGRRSRRVAFVIQRDKFDLATMDAAGRIDSVEIHLGALMEGFGQRRTRTGQWQ